MSDATKPLNPSYLFQLTCDCGNGKNLVVSFNADNKASAAELNAEVDKLNVVFDRQRAKHDAPLLEERVEGTRLEIERLETELEQYRVKHPGRALDQNLVSKLELQIKSAKIALARGEITYEKTLKQAE
jgi:hypothetical protein